MASIAVVTPSYNQAAFLEEAIDSVLGQGSYLTECVVLDACSDDGSRAILDRRSNDIRSRGELVIEPDRGQSDAIIKGFSRTTSDILCWINSDDALLPGALRAVSDRFDSDPTLDVVVGDFVFIDESSVITRYKSLRGARPWWRHFGVLHVPQQSCFFRRSAYDRAGGLDDSLHCVMDADLWIRLMECNTRWGYVHRPLSAFRIHGAAKGKEAGWSGRYGKEAAWMRVRHASVLGGRRWSQAGSLAYKMTNTLNGVYARDWLYDRRWKGKSLASLANECRSSDAGF